jgi:hypothetical protein
MKKVLIAVGLMLVFGLFIAAFSLAPAVAQYPRPSTGTSCAGNTSGIATYNSTSTANASDTKAQMPLVEKHCQRLICYYDL